MPKKVVNKSSTQGTRKSLKGRTPGQRIVRKGCAPKEAPAIVIANSIFALTLKPKTGPEVLFQLGAGDGSTKVYEKMFQDLWGCYMRLHWLVKHEGTDFCPLKAGMSLPMALHMAIAGFGSLVPKGYSYNIDEKDGRHHFTIYQYCEGWGMNWHTLEVGHVLQVLHKQNRPLHDLFLSFIKTFSRSAGVPLWGDGMMGSMIDSLQDELANMEEDADPLDVESMKEDIEAYNVGLPAKYDKLILKARSLKPAELKRKAARFKSQIANLIFMGCDVMLLPNRIKDFDYQEEQYDDYYFLQLDSQANIIWSDDDNLLHTTAGYLDAIAQEGVQEPIFSVVIDKNLEKFDLEELHKKSRWIGELGKFFDKANDIIFKFKKDEPINGKAIKSLSPKACPRRICA